MFRLFAYGFCNILLLYSQHILHVVRCSSTRCLLSIRCCKAFPLPTPTKPLRTRLTPISFFSGSIRYPKREIALHAPLCLSCSSMHHRPSVVACWTNAHPAAPDFFHSLIYQGSQWLIYLLKIRPVEGDDRFLERFFFNSLTRSVLSGDRKYVFQ